MQSKTNCVFMRFPKIDEEFFEDSIVEHLHDQLGYEHLYGPDIVRTSDRYDDVFLSHVLPAALEPLFFMDFRKFLYVT